MCLPASLADFQNFRQIQESISVIQSKSSDFKKKNIKPRFIRYKIRYKIKLNQVEKSGI